MRGKKFTVLASDNFKSVFEGYEKAREDLLDSLIEVVGKRNRKNDIFSLKPVNQILSGLIVPEIIVQRNDTDSIILVGLAEDFISLDVR